MAQAHRVRRAGQRSRPSEHATLLEGSYSFEQKITVEWERELALDEFDSLLTAILGEPRSFAEIRTHVSGALKERDPSLPPGKISKYRVSERSLRKTLKTLLAAKRLTSVEAPGSRVRLWSRP